MKLKSILAATGKEQLDKAFSAVKGYEVVDIVKTKKELEEVCDFYNPDILIVSEGLRGSQSLKEILFKIINKHRELRIIYLAGSVDMKDFERVNALGYLVLSGVTDIIVETKFNMEILNNILNNPKRFEDVKIFTKNITSNEVVAEALEFEEEMDSDLDEIENPYNKIYTVSSIKPGSGKSFMVSNIATAIAKYGKKKPNGQRPKVAIIEGDLQNLSVGTLLQIEDPKWNLKTALDAIATLFNEDGDLIAKASQMDEVNRIIKNCMKPYYHVKNLYALTGSQISYSALLDVKPHYYIYLMEAILDDYDVIIVDSNSNVGHVTTEPVMYMAKTCYYVINLDFNNIRNNARYRKTLNEMQILEKVKYILNEDVEEDSAIGGTDIEELEFDKVQLRENGFNTVAEIPMVPKAIFLNRLHDGKPVVLDDNEYTLKVKYQFFRVCNEIWEMEDFDKIEREALGLNNLSKKKGLLW